MARLFWECLVQTSSARVRPRAALTIDLVRKQAIGRHCRDRLARQLTVVALSFIPILDVRHRQSRVGCLTRAASSTRYNSQKLAG